jgi:hypothetical protein
MEELQQRKIMVQCGGGYTKSSDAHYSKTKFQATEFIFDAGHGEGFCIGNAMKYLQRYGRKDGYNRKDLMKVLHYAIMTLYIHDTEKES